MHKGEVVEEGDHGSLMNALGTYHALVEQQNLRQAEEEEKLAFEREESQNTSLVTDPQTLGVTFERKRASTVVSLTPSIKHQLYGKLKNADTDEDKKNAEDTEVKPKKVQLTTISFI